MLARRRICWGVLAAVALAPIVPVLLGVVAQTSDTAALVGLQAGAETNYLPFVARLYPPATPTPTPTITPTPAPLAVVTSIAMGAPEGLAADRATGRVYVADDDTNSIVVIADASQTVVDTFPLSGDVKAVAYDRATNRLFAGYSRPIRVLDAATGTQLSTIDESLYADHEIAINPTNRKLYLGDWTVVLGRADKALIYHADTLEKLGEISLGIDPNVQRVGVAVNSETGMAYASYTAADEVTFIDGATNGVVRVVALAEDIVIPPAIAVDPTADRIYVLCSDKTVVLDGATGDCLGDIDGFYNTRATQGVGHIYQAVNNRFRVLDGATFGVLGEVTLPGYMGYGGMDFIPSTRRVYVAVSYADQVAVIQE